MDIKKLLERIRTDLHDEFDQNFVRKSFFGDKWPATKIPNHKGSLMIRTATLRNSLKSSVKGNSIVFESPLPYADIHNSGGVIIVTMKMKKYFWYRYSQLARYTNGKQGKHVVAINAQAQIWKALALKKVGDKIKIQKRQFVGNHPRVESRIKTIAEDYFLNEFEKLFKR